MAESNQAIAALKQAVSDYADRSDARGQAVLEGMEHLERGRNGELELVLFPADAAELQAVVKALAAAGLPSTTISGQTGLVEAQRAQGIAISTRDLNAPIALQLQDGSALAFSPKQAGLSYTEQLEQWRDELTQAAVGKDLTEAVLQVQAGMAIDAINGRSSTGDEPGGFPGVLQGIGRKIPVVMASTPTATIGATVANGSAGANAVRYGTAADMAVWAEGVLGTGELVRHHNNGRAAAEADAPVIRSDRFSHGDSLIGSQGAFGIITAVAVQTFAEPKEQVITLFPVADCAEAQHVLAAARDYFSEAGEDIELFELVRGETLQRAQEHAQKRAHAAAGPYYVLMQLMSENTYPESEFFPDHSAFFEKMAMFFMDGLHKADGSGLMFPDAEGVDYDSTPHRLMTIREAASEMSRGKPKRTYDVVVPLARLDALVAGLERIARDDFPAMQLEIFGHAGVGALHVHFIGEAGERAAALDTAVFDLTESLHGSPWAEHGVGSKWADAWQQRTPQAVQEDMLALVKRHDPQNVIGSYLFGFNRYFNQPDLRDAA